MKPDGFVIRTPEFIKTAVKRTARPVLILFKIGRIPKDQRVRMRMRHIFRLKSLKKARYKR
jgi:hypothetical protein